MAKDGTILIDTAIETDGFKNGTKELESACRSAANSVENIGNKAKIALQKSANLFSRQNSAYAEQEKKVQGLKQQLEELSRQEVYTDEFKRADAEAEKLADAFEALIQKQKRFIATGGSTDSKTYKLMDYDLEKLGASMDAAISKRDKLLSSGKAMQPVDTTAISGKLDAETEKLRHMGLNLETTYASLKDQINDYSNSLKKSDKEQKKNKKSGKGLNNSLKTIKKGFASGAKSLLKYVFGLETIFALFRKLRSGISEGIKNLVKFDGTTNKSMSGITSALATLKNASATAFAPVLNAVAPILTRIINLLTEAITKVGQFVAALTGQKTFVKAVAVQKDYAESLDGTSDAAEKAADNLSGLDEINKWQSNDTSTASGKDASGMFETVPIESKISSFAEKVKKTLSEMFAPMKAAWEKYGDSISATLSKIGTKFIDTNKRIGAATIEWFKNLDWSPLMGSIDNLLLKFEPLFATLSDFGVNTYEKILLPLAKWTMEEAAPAVINDLAEAFRALNAILSPAFDGLMIIWEKAQPIIQWIKDVAIVAIRGIGDIFSSVADVFEEKGSQIQQIFSDVGQIIQDVWFLVEPIFSKLKSTVQFVFQQAAKWISASFGDIIDVVQSVVSVFKNLISFIKNVFSGNWSEAMNSLAEVGKSAWQSFVNGLKSIANAGLSILDSFANFFIKAINSLLRGINKISFDTPSWVPLIGGKKFGFNIPLIKEVNIPKLATGAVIPPNAPFLAQLGDQKNGNNLEMPENLLRQIVREESGGREPITVIAKAKAKTIFEMVIDEGKQRQTQTGKNPFDLAY